MRNFCAKCVYVVILQFVFVASALANTLTLGEQGEVFAETDGYQVRFKDGVLVHFHNKLTQETYTLPPQGDSNGESGLSIQHEEGEDDHSELIDDTWEVETRRLSPLSVEVAYHSDYSSYRRDYRFDKTVWIRISIDAATGDLVIRQHGISKHIISIMWGCGYLNRQQVDVILPAHGGEIIDASSEISKRGFRHFEYPERWEAQLAILQGGNGGFFVRSTDTTFRFKAVHHIPSGEHFGMSFKTHNPAPFRDKHEITSVEWRLNAYRGDWQVPAEIYRNWMEVAFQPKQPPAWVKDLEVVIYAPYQPLDISILPLLAEHVNPSTTLLYIIGWYDPTMGLEPDYPPDPEFGDFLKAAHAYGFRVMPRITFHGCSPYSPLYPEFEKYQFRHPTRGTKLGYSLNDPTYDYPTAYINPASKAFRKYVVEQMKTLYETYPIDALHLDINTSVVNDANGLIDGLTAAEGNVLLHQEFAEAMPGIVLGGENVHEVTFSNTNLAQRWSRHNKQPHPISSFLFSTWTIPYGFHVPNPDREPEFYQPFQEAYVVWGVLPTIRIRAHRELTNPNMVKTRGFLRSVRMGQSWEQTWNIDVAQVAPGKYPPLYWIDAKTDTLQHFVDNEVESLVSGIQNATRLAVDAAAGKLYWTEKTGNRTGKIQAANLDGTNVQPVRNLTSAPLDITLDITAGKLYLSNAWGKIQRMNLDGSNFQPNLITGLKTPQHLVLDSAGGHLYWTEQTGKTTGKIQRANLDGASVQLVKKLTSAPRGMVLDPVNRKLYLINAWGKLQRMNLDGSNFQPNLITGLESPGQVAVDVVDGKVYWTEEGKLRRADLNGENIQDVVTGLGELADIALGIQPSSMDAAAPMTQAVPEQTRLLANYPNPFNPETWIPYHLANSSNVQITIYDTRGSIVRQLNLGHQREGYYTSRSRAAYWDGRNDVGERVASGVYFYQLQAEGLSYLRKMVILK